jgi:tRNA-dihydrouridine synthase
MKEAVDVPVTLKHRLGVRRSYGKQSNAPTSPDALDSYDFVTSFVDDVHSLSGVEHFVVHARCAVLGGLSTTANRNVPPLRYDEVHRLAEDFPNLGFSLNGGVETVDEAVAHLKSGKLRGVMMGRAVYRNPAILADVDRVIYGVTDGAHRGKVEVCAADERIKWRDDGWVATGRTKTSPTAPLYRRRETFFALDSDRQVPCVTRLDVLRRFAVYGDAVLAKKRDELEKHPKALGEARALAKAVGGVSYGVRLGASFKRNLESGLGRWTERLLSGDSAESLSFANLVEDCVEGLGAEGAEDMETPMFEPLFSERRRRGEVNGDLKAADAACAGETRESTDSGS